MTTFDEVQALLDAADLPFGSRVRISVRGGSVITGTLVEPEDDQLPAALIVDADAQEQNHLPAQRLVVAWSAVNTVRPAPSAPVQSGLPKQPGAPLTNR